MSETARRRVLTVFLAVFAVAVVWLVGWGVPLSVRTGSIAVSPELDTANDSEQTLYTADVELSGSEAYTEIMRFNQENVSLNMFCRRDPLLEGASDTLTVELHRVRWGLFDEYVGSFDLKRSGDGSATWMGVGEGDYYFRFIKEGDGQTVSAGAALFYSVSYD